MSVTDGQEKVMGARTVVRAPLTLSVGRESWRLHDAAYWADPAVQRLREAVVRRDDFRCQFCHFQSAPADAADMGEGQTRYERSVGYMQVHPVNGDHSTLTKAAHVTCCPFCHALAHAGVASPGANGVLIYYPAMEVGEFNLFLNALAIASRPGTGMHYQANYIYKQLEAFKAPVTNLLGQEAHDPEIFAAGVLSCRERFPDAYARLDLIGRGIRFLPTLDAYKIQIDWFSRHAVPPADGWPQLLTQWRAETQSTEPETNG